MSTTYKQYNDFGKELANLKVDNEIMAAALAGGGLRMVTVTNTGVLAAQAIPTGLTDGDYGEITISAGGTLISVDPDAISNTKLANMANNTFKARISAGAGDPEDISIAQATSMLNVFTNVLKGLTPASGGGTVNFLRADGTWAAPPAGGGGTPAGSDRQVQFNNAGAFGASSNLVLNSSGELLIGGITDQGAYPLQVAGGFYFRHSAVDLMSYTSTGVIQVQFGQPNGKIILNKSFAGTYGLELADNTAGYIKFGSASGSGFMPYIDLRPDGTIQDRSLITSHAGSDSGTVAALQLNSSLWNDTALSTKPILSISNGFIDKILVAANGNLTLYNYTGTGDKLAQFDSTGLLVRGTIDPANILLKAVTNTLDTGNTVFDMNGGNFTIKKTGVSNNLKFDGFSGSSPVEVMTLNSSSLLVTRTFAQFRADMKMPQLLHVNTTNVGNVGVGEDDLMSYVLPAGTLANNGDSVDIIANFTLAINGNAKAVTLYFGSNMVTVNTGTFGGMQIRVTVIRISATSQKALFSYTILNSSGSPAGAGDASLTETLSSTVTIKASGNATSDNDIIQTGMTVRYWPI